VSIKFLFTFLIFLIYSVYFAFLNQGEMDIRVTQEITLNLPRVVFLLLSVLIGVLITTLFSWICGFKRYFSDRKVRKGFQKEIDDRIRGEQIFEKAENAFATGRYDKAQSHLEKLLNGQPDHVGALLHLGLIKQKEGKNEEAMEYHLKAVEQAPDNIRVLYSLAEEYLEAGNSEQAMVFLKKIRDFDRTSLAPLYKMRDYYEEQEDWDNAYSTQKAVLPLIRDKEELISEQKRYGNIIYSKGVELYKKGSVDQALVEFKKCMKEAPEFAMPYIFLGDIQKAGGNEKAAIKTWKAGFEVARSYACLDRIQKIYESTDKAKEITKLYQDAIANSVGKEKEDLILIFGMRLLDQGDLDETIKTLSSDSENSSLIRNILLAKAYNQKEAKEEAKKTEEVIFNSAKESVFELAGLSKNNGNK
jgi:lipopolysaccharide assembly protein B